MNGTRVAATPAPHPIAESQNNDTVQNNDNESALTVSRVSDTTTTTNSTATSGSRVSHGLSKPAPDEASASEQAARRLTRLKTVLLHPIGDYAVAPWQASMAAHGATVMHYIDGASYPQPGPQAVAPSLISPITCNALPLTRRGVVFTGANVKRLLIRDDPSAASTFFSSFVRFFRGAPAGSPTVCGLQYERETDEKQDEINAINAPGTADASVGSPAQIKLKETVTVWADRVVWAAGVFNLYSTLERSAPSLACVTAFKDVPGSRSISPSKGHLYLYVKFDAAPEVLRLPSHNLWYFHEDDMQAASARFDQCPLKHRPAYVYVGFPCTHTPQWKETHPNASNAVVICEADFAWFKTMDSERYSCFKTAMSDKLLEILHELVPQTRNHVSWHSLGTPKTEARYLHSFRGGSYGTKGDCELFHDTQKNVPWTMNVYTPVRGLFMGGSDGFLPSFTGAMYGGALAAIAAMGPARAAGLCFSVVREAAKEIRRREECALHKKEGCDCAICKLFAVVAWGRSWWKAVVNMFA
jgi:hypothetical protein